MKNFDPIHPHKTGPDMYKVTYKTILRRDREESEFLFLLKKFWPMQKGWGAQSLRTYRPHGSHDHVIMCEYSVPDIDYWIDCAIGPEGARLNQALSEVVETHRLSLKITNVPETNA